MIYAAVLQILKNDSGVTSFFNSGDNMRIEPIVYQKSILPAATLHIMDENPTPNFDDKATLVPVEFEALIFAESYSKTREGWLAIIKALDTITKYTHETIILQRIRYAGGGMDNFDTETNLYIKNAKFLIHYRTT